MTTQTETIDVIPSFSFAAPSPPVVAERIQQQPECHLLWAILESDIKDYMRYATATGRRSKRLFREAEAWIMADEPTWLCSFVSICHILGLDPDYLRAGLSRWHDAHCAPPLKRAA